MKTITEHIRDHMYTNLGMVKRKVMPSLEELYKSEWSSRFERLMRNRLVLGAMRYGLLHAKGKPQYNRVGSCIKRLKLYEKTRNSELLVDVANLCLMEFEEGDNHFEAIDECEEKGHVNVIKS